MNVFAGVSLLLVGVLLGLQAWRWTDDRRATELWERLAQKGRGAPAAFDPSMVAALPEPARRYFAFTIRSGARLHTVAEIRMSGEIGLGTKENPHYQPMTAEQVLAPPHGLIWKLCAGRGAMRIVGSDGFDDRTSWTRFWLLSTLPIVRVGGTSDHARSAFGRVVAEAAFWTPAALLPNEHVTWVAVDAHTARATITANGITQAVDVTVADDGRPTMIVIPRWSNANAEKTYRAQPFGGYLSEFRDFDGYRLPTRVEGGNLIGTREYFPFYKVKVDSIRFPTVVDRSRTEPGSAVH